jgi:hypothetical protein
MLFPIRYYCKIRIATQNAQGLCVQPSLTVDSGQQCFSKRVNCAEYAKSCRFLSYREPDRELSFCERIMAYE